jgi:CRISPR-associated endonuclease/helicase Cas3
VGIPPAFRCRSHLAKTLYVKSDSAYSWDVVKTSETGQFFRRYFPLLSGISSGAYHWQEELFERLIEGEWPRDICLPTGMGKTSVMAIWILALVWEVVYGPGQRPVARRLVWVVNRRVVVDQATEVAVKLAEQIQAIPELRDALNALSVEGGGLAVSTLRGELADNRDWKRDPTRPAIIVGTVDMVGSRLLFSGYGDGKWYRPHHAGLLGRDVVIINDESHLTPAFSALLEGIAELQNDPAFRVMRLSATPRGTATQWPESVQADFAEHEEFRKRFDAPKRLFMHAVAKRDLEHEIFRLAVMDGVATRVLVFVRQPEKAAEFANRIEKQFEPRRVSLLTGTMRGWDRDQLVKEDPAFGVFLKPERPAERYWLVATSAAEVGVNLTSDLLITDLETADHLIQRFGRLNRFGETEGVAHLVHAQALDAKQEREARTLEYFAGLSGSAEEGYDISCRHLRENPPTSDTLSEEPLLARLDSRLIDLWSQTSAARNLAVPPVEDWLHGKQEDEGPETEVAWRADVELLARPGVNPDELENAIDHYPVLARERLKEPTKRVKEKLDKLPADTRVICILRNGDVAAYRLDDLPDLEYATVLLPAGCGSIVRGMFQPVATRSERYDVADDGDERARYTASATGDLSTLTLIGSSEPEPLEASPEAFAKKQGMKVVATVAIPPVGAPPDSDMEMNLVYLRKADGKKVSSLPVLLKTHEAKVAEMARKMAEKAGLTELALVFETAGRLHDHGKGDAIWQAAVGGSVEEPIAKPAKQFPPGQLGGFRHEFSSLRKAGNQRVDELALHLIASHHGWARPHFPLRAFDRHAVRDSQRTALESAQRFGRLQGELGAWRLAYLEAIFKAADALVSEQEREQPTYG